MTKQVYDDHTPDELTIAGAYICFFLSNPTPAQIIVRNRDGKMFVPGTSGNYPNYISTPGIFRGRTIVCDYEFAPDGPLVRTPEWPFAASAKVWVAPGEHAEAPPDAAPVPGHDGYVWWYRS